MDQSVLDALQRWPNVPHVYGWLSLDKRGRWRLHPRGDGAMPGESITNEQILGFMNRNYAADDNGCWFFQNGPQRVYVILEGAPYILRLDDEGRGLRTHNGLGIQSVERWLLDEDGQLWAATGIGPGLVEDRDLPALLNQLHLPDGRALLDAPEALEQGAQVSGPGGRAPLQICSSQNMAAQLGFVARPR